MVAGDSRGTASTLVGLTPEEELELAMLKSSVAAEQPPEPPLGWNAPAAPARPTHAAPLPGQSGRVYNGVHTQVAFECGNEG